MKFYLLVFSFFFIETKFSALQNSCIPLYLSLIFISLSLYLLSIISLLLFWRETKKKWRVESCYKNGSIIQSVPFGILRSNLQHWCFRNLIRVIYETLIRIIWYIFFSFFLLLFWKRGLTHIWYITDYLFLLSRGEVSNREYEVISIYFQKLIFVIRQNFLCNLR